MKKIRLAVSDFALPSPRTGSIESLSGYGTTMQEGMELHKWLQEAKASAHEHYQSEVKISHHFQLGGFEFQVEGRMDGFFEGDEPLIEEIKSTFNIWELAKILRERGFGHPYNVQLMTYGYFYWLKHNQLPRLAFQLISSRNKEVMEVEVVLDVAKYEAWLELRLKDLVIEVKRAEKRMLRRKGISRDLAFPFEKPRNGQLELIATIEEGMLEGRPMMLQAPTGLGKTMGVLYPSLKEATSRGQRVVYVTPKNSQHSVAEDAIDKFQQQGCKVKSLTLTAKSKLCMKAEPICNPEYCEFAKDYYDKLHANDLVTILSKKKNLSAKVFKNLGEKYQVCPFELQLEAAQEADAVICDYNYVFANRSALNRVRHLQAFEEGKPNLVIDEAHNLPSRALGYYSPSLGCFALERMREDIRTLPKKYAKECEGMLNECLQVIKLCKPSGIEKGAKIELPLEEFLLQDESLRSFVSKYLESDIEIKAQDPVMRLHFYWAEFTDILRQISEVKRPEFFTSFQPDQWGGMVKITCCDASEMLKPRYLEFEHVIAFSATLKPFDYYARLSGLENVKLKMAEFKSPFHEMNRKMMVIPQISTKFSQREKNYSKISEAISKIILQRSGNYLAFFPSFDFMEKVAQLFIAPLGVDVLKQGRNMKNYQVEEVLIQLKERKRPSILFAVQGGTFSEGVDYPGEMVIGAFVIGPPLPSFDFEREEMRGYYEQNFKQGFDYAYTYPAMARAVQSAGRVIRSEEDKGIIIMMDERFLESSYSKSMPVDWFKDSPKELVSKSILNDISEFWKSHQNLEKN